MKETAPVEKTVRSTESATSKNKVTVGNEITKSISTVLADIPLGVHPQGQIRGAIKTIKSKGPT
uniref:Uncharacterized protein n=1 Tax=Pristionchus pacificus TaxID=54126 RepID=A0A2A6BNL3_PRIPA|eukprot:PDM67510.1 hypothetical protein PRIPAC_48927 [Pristionchus pacificus]